MSSDKNIVFNSAVSFNKILIVFKVMIKKNLNFGFVVILSFWNGKIWILICCKAMQTLPNLKIQKLHMYLY